MVKEPPANAGDESSISRSGRSARKGNSYPLQYPTWEISWTEVPGELQSIASQYDLPTKQQPSICTTKEMRLAWSKEF